MDALSTAAAVAADRLAQLGELVEAACSTLAALPGAPDRDPAVRRLHSTLLLLTRYLDDPPARLVAFHAVSPGSDIDELERAERAWAAFEATILTCHAGATDRLAAQGVLRRDLLDQLQKRFAAALAEPAGAPPPDDASAVYGGRQVQQPQTAIAREVLHMFAARTFDPTRSAVRQDTRPYRGLLRKIFALYDVSGDAYYYAGEALDWWDKTGRQPVRYPP